MKRFVMSFTLLLLSTVLSTAQKNQVVDIQYTGAQEHPIKSTVISARPLKEETKAKMLERIGIDDRFSHIDKGRIWSKNYDEIITDKRSLKKVIKFIIREKKSLDDGSHSIYDIQINDKKYTVPASFQQVFFKDMIRYLIKKNCDPKLILDLKNLDLITVQQ